MLHSVIDLTTERVNLWKHKFAGKDVEMDLSQEVSDLVMDVVQACIFGMECVGKQIGFMENGKMRQVGVGTHARSMVLSLMERMFSFPRNLFPSLDTWTFN